MFGFERFRADIVGKMSALYPFETSIPGLEFAIGDPLGNKMKILAGFGSQQT